MTPLLVLIGVLGGPAACADAGPDGGASDIEISVPVVLEFLTASWDTAGTLHVQAAASHAAGDLVDLAVTIPIWLVSCSDSEYFTVTVRRAGAGWALVDTVVTARFPYARPLLLSARATTTRASAEDTLDAMVPAYTPPFTISAYLEKQYGPFQPISPDSLVVGDTIAIRVSADAYWGTDSTRVDWGDGATDRTILTCLEVVGARMFHAYDQPGSPLIVITVWDGTRSVSDTIPATVR